MNEKYQKYLYLLTTLGLKSREAEVYFALLRLKQSTVGKISKITSIQRTYIYDILRNLDEKGIVSSIEIRGRKYYSAISIDKFKKRQEYRLKQLKETIPEIKSLIGYSKNSPKVQYYEGKEGFVEAQNDTLTLPRGGEILAYYTGEGFYETDPDVPEQYVKRRVERKIRVRAIGTDTKAIKVWSKRDRKQLRESRLVPPEVFPFENEINIYGNKISILSLTDEMIAVVIESESIANTQRAIFELAWIGAKEVKK